MKLTNIEDLNAFKETVDSCEGDVILTSPYGDRYNLKSIMSQYIGLAALLGEHGDEMELFCMFPGDESRFIQLFRDKPEILGMTA